MRVNLKIAILVSGRTQRQLAAVCEIPENRFSSIVNGWTDPRDAERGAIAAVLGRPIEELFERQVSEQRQRREPLSAV